MSDPFEFIDPDQLKLDLQIDTTNLTKAMIDQLGFFVFYSNQAIKARRNHDEAKSRLELTEAALKSKYRKQFTEESGKVTEGQIDAAVRTDPAHRTATLRAIDAAEIKSYAETAREAFEQRKSLILQIAKDAASEQFSIRNSTVAGGKEGMLAAMAKTAAAA